MLIWIVPNAASATACGGDISVFRNCAGWDFVSDTNLHICDTTTTAGFKHLLSKMQMQRTVWQDDDEEPLDGTNSTRSRLRTSTDGILR
jgi:hypothetical protein